MMPNPDTRPVWPTRDLRDLIYFAAQHLPDHEREQLEQLVDAWDAAPADAAEAVRDALRPGRRTVYEERDAVLSALGMPA